MTMKQCKDYGLKCLKCPHWNNWTNFCTKWKITTSTSGDGMTKKRFEVIMNEFDEIEYIIDKEMMGDRDFADFMDFVEEVCKENEQLKQSYKEFEDECQSTFNAMNRKQNDLYRKNFKLKEENEQLKQREETLLCEIEDFQELLAKNDSVCYKRVIDLIDTRIKNGEEAIEWGKNMNADYGAMGFYIEMLKKLKKELEG